MDSVRRLMQRQPVQLIMALVGVNIFLWTIVLSVSKTYPVLISPAILAYSFGLRHAVDADHIAAIDNVTRKFMNEGKRPTTIGLFFSLGHSTVVVLLTIGVIFSSKFISTHLDSSKEIGSIIGTSVSAFFLLLIGIINLRVLKRSYDDWKAIQQGATTLPSQHDDEQLQHEAEAVVEGRSAPTGFGAICCPGLFRVIDTPWKMYPLGFLFGLGFDTASEVALLGIAAMTSKQDLPTIAVILLPLLFTAGMTLIDTLDGIFMLWAYGWAFINPTKKTFYNMFLTGTSAMVAFFVGGVEACGIMVEHLNLQAKFWVQIHALSENFEALGFIIIGIFACTFLLSVAMYHCTQRNMTKANDPLGETSPLVSSTQQKELETHAV